MGRVLGLNLYFLTKCHRHGQQLSYKIHAAISCYSEDLGYSYLFLLKVYHPGILLVAVIVVKFRFLILSTFVILSSSCNRELASSPAYF